VQVVAKYKCTRRNSQHFSYVC